MEVLDKSGASRKRCRAEEGPSYGGVITGLGDCGNYDEGELPSGAGSDGCPNEELNEASARAESPAGARATLSSEPPIRKVPECLVSAAPPLESSPAGKNAEHREAESTGDVLTAEVRSPHAEPGKRRSGRNLRRSDFFLTSREEMVKNGRLAVLPRQYDKRKRGRQKLVGKSAGRKGPALSFRSV